MSNAVISVENLSKSYIIGHQRNRHDGLRHRIEEAFRNPLQWLRDRKQAVLEEREEFWALKDVSFEIKQGEVVGIIGRNGAGKSTLLKILSRITEPTSGQIRIKGRVASLLEVGTGFHPELTGRENIFLNGAILGMHRAEIKKKFDEIVAFSEIEKFLDTPVKRYSSGMYVRLAFAVAAHLEPEILIVDEVLAVGDAAFQKKCLNKMQDVRDQGRAILFVSHDITAITRLCSRAILLEQGKLTADGPVHEVSGEYLRNVGKIGAERIWSDPMTAPHNDVVRLQALRVFDADRNVKESFDVRKPIGLEFEYEVLQDGHLLVPCLSLRTETGALICLLHEHNSNWYRKKRPVGRYSSVVWIPENFMSEGSFLIGAAIGTHQPSAVMHAHAGDNVVGFRVIDFGEGDTARGDYGGHLPGVIRPNWEWETGYFARNGTSATDV